MYIYYKKYNIRKSSMNHGLPWRIFRNKPRVFFFSMWDDLMGSDKDMAHANSNHFLVNLKVTVGMLFMIYIYINILYIYVNVNMLHNKTFSYIFNQ